MRDNVTQQRPEQAHTLNGFVAGGPVASRSAVITWKVMAWKEPAAKDDTEKFPWVDDLKTGYSQWVTWVAAKQGPWSFCLYVCVLFC